MKASYQRGTMKHESPNSKMHINTAKPPAINGRSKARTIKMLECEPTLWPCSFSLLSAAEASLPPQDLLLVLRYREARVL